MPIKYESDTEATIVLPIGERNEEWTLSVTEEGLEGIDGWELLPWEWIDQARKKVQRHE